MRRARVGPESTKLHFLGFPQFVLQGIGAASVALSLMHTFFIFPPPAFTIHAPTTRSTTFTRESAAINKRVRFTTRSFPRVDASKFLVGGHMRNFVMRQNKEGCWTLVSEVTALSRGHPPPPTFIFITPRIFPYFNAYTSSYLQPSNFTVGDNLDKNISIQRPQQFLFLLPTL
ncbi:putative siderophore biosynthesis protein [Corchorus olitorius]|uniref:Siderophore biosynthesis protein n=1 Tax=Corchorus olitorius TaxID=93759 RepID=A0A1R3JU35_9ROSI|nr:putative siderophore biosynthesis protein [Corchorus olitorius]